MWGTIEDHDGSLLLILLEQMLQKCLATNTIMPKVEAEELTNKMSPLDERFILLYFDLSFWDDFVLFVILNIF